MKIPISKPSIGKEEIDSVMEVLKSGNLVQGKQVEAFEKEFSSYLGTRYAIATSSGTSALQIAIETLGIPEGSEIITTPFTFIATANSILYNKCKPVFADINPKTFNIDPQKIEEKITSKTKALLIVHLFGQPCEMESITKICKQNNLILIEDCAQSLGAEYKNKKTGTFGDISTFSFYATKNITTGEGGMIAANNENIEKESKIIRNQGQDGHYNHVRLAFNERMTDIEAAIGKIQLKKLEFLNKKRTENARILSENLEKMQWIETPYIIENVKHSWHQYTIKIQKNRDSFLNHMEKNGIGAKIYYPTPLNLQPVYSGMNQKCPIAEGVSSQVVSLPVHPELKPEEIGEIVNAIKSFSL